MVHVTVLIVSAREPFNSYKIMNIDKRIGSKFIINHKNRDREKTNKQTNKQNKTKQNKTKQNKTKQNKTKQNKNKKTKQNKTKQNNSLYKYMYKYAYF